MLEDGYRTLDGQRRELWPVLQADLRLRAALNNIRESTGTEYRRLDLAILRCLKWINIYPGQMAEERGASIEGGEENSGTASKFVAACLGLEAKSILRRAITDK
jgi:hypothetical protein